MRQIFTPNWVSWHVAPFLHSASELQSWRTGPVGAPASTWAHDVWHVDVDIPPPPAALVSRQQTFPGSQLAALVQVSAALPLHVPTATHVSVAPPPPPLADTQHSSVPIAHLDAPHEIVGPDGGVDVGEPVGDPVGELVGEQVGEPVAIEGGVVVGPLPAGSEPTDGLAGSVGLVVDVVPPMRLPSVEPPHAAAARTPRSEAAKSAVTGSAVFIWGEHAVSSGAARGRVSSTSRLARARPKGRFFTAECSDPTAKNVAETWVKHHLRFDRARMNAVNSGDTAWLLVSTALVLLMTPALALFYGGMVRKKNVLSTIMHSLSAIPLVTLVWVLYGYSLAFGPSHHGLIGSFGFIGLQGLETTTHGTVPSLAFVAFQMMFAIITPALISGAFAERMKFSAYVVFVLAWSTFVYVPVAHWVWADDGWLLKMGALDFAGGTVVHLTAGGSALVCALVIGKRLKYPQERPLPHNLTMTLTGAGILWFGWFGFNAGSALTSGWLAALAFMNTHLGAAGGALGWVVIEWKHRGKPTALGIASGLVAGLVAITPAAGYVSPVASIAIGFIAALVCYLGVLAKYKYGYDDSLDAFGVHGVGGLTGAILTGVFCMKRSFPGVTDPVGEAGLLAGNPKQLGVQILACAVSLFYAVAVTWVILKVIDKTVGLRVTVSDEREGLDTTQHGEDGYAG